MQDNNRGQKTRNLYPSNTYSSIPFHYSLPNFWKKHTISVFIEGTNNLDLCSRHIITFQFEYIDTTKIILVLISLAPIKRVYHVYNIHKRYLCNGSLFVYVFPLFWNWPNLETGRFLLNYFLKVALSQKVEVDFQIAQNECRKLFCIYRFNLFTGSTNRF